MYILFGNTFLKILLIFTNIYCIIILIRVNYLQLLKKHKQCYRVHYIPLNYCKKVLTTDGTSEKLKDVAGSLYTYSHLADYYFGKIQSESTPDPEED